MNAKSAAWCLLAIYLSLDFIFATLINSTSILLFIQAVFFTIAQEYIQLKWLFLGATLYFGYTIIGGIQNAEFGATVTTFMSGFKMSYNVATISVILFSACLTYAVLGVSIIAHFILKKKGFFNRFGVMKA